MGAAVRTKPNVPASWLHCVMVAEPDSSATAKQEGASARRGRSRRALAGTKVRLLADLPVALERARSGRARRVVEGAVDLADDLGRARRTDLALEGALAVDGRPRVGTLDDVVRRRAEAVIEESVDRAGDARQARSEDVGQRRAEIESEGAA